MAGNGSSEFTRREWFLLIALLLMIEAWILHGGYSFKDEQSVLNYVSFASTIASLLLAILAIIYGFYQSDGQKTFVAEIATQITAMSRVEQQLDDSTRQIASQLATLSDTTRTLKSIGDAIEGTHSRLGTIEGGLSKLTVSHEAIAGAIAAAASKAQAVSAQSAPAATEIAVGQATINLADIARAILRESSYDADLLGYSLYQIAKRPELHNADLYDMLSKHYSRPLAEAKMHAAKESSTWFSTGLALTAVLKRFDLISNDVDKETGDRAIQISPTLSALLEQFAAETKANDFTLKGCLAIDASFESPPATSAAIPAPSF